MTKLAIVTVITIMPILSFATPLPPVVIGVTEEDFRREREFFKARQDRIDQAEEDKQQFEHYPSWEWNEGKERVFQARLHHLSPTEQLELAEKLIRNAQRSVRTVPKLNSPVPRRSFCERLLSKILD